MSDIAAHLGKKNETIDALLAENIRLREQLMQAIEREQKIAKAGAGLALSFAENLRVLGRLRASMGRAINGLNGALDAPEIKDTPGVIHAQMTGAALDLEESLGSVCEAPSDD